MLNIRKLQMIREELRSELGAEAERPVIRAAGLAVVQNPFAGRFAEDLTPLWEIGAQLAERLMPDLVRMLSGPAVSYGKGAVVGVAGEMEHGGACIHPRLGRPMRAAIGGGAAVIPSNVKVAAAGTPLDLPLGHKDDPWSFAHFDTITVFLADAPRPDEILVALAVADGGRLRNRCGAGPAR
ncbi:amino acid synthesis family protein [Roseomonas frigidaquae]|uniref:Amino acid synthesis family protein n=1 Tax=Falsiroseomonas frigidaquae TaxID=487318 RepID=A0ABX1F6I0_9PROT|nr:amino acid synthesis family protein [Falsiroseomonas frigidaquae]NKE47952.1 amino acid synthesis family protein [Falsiroseomonas frigidaquae]